MAHAAAAITCLAGFAAGASRKVSTLSGVLQLLRESCGGRGANRQGDPLPSAAAAAAAAVRLLRKRSTAAGSLAFNLAGFIMRMSAAWVSCEPA
jgi:hypothetical protein